jgi:phosphoadenosine phosphosulfate reductase
MLQIPEASPSDLLLHALKSASRDHGPAAFALSLSDGDKVITDVILGAGLDIEIFTVASGPPDGEQRETLELIRRVYGHEVRVYDASAATPSYLTELYGSGVVDPLKRALHGKNAWITASRGSPAAPSVPPYEYDSRYGILRFNPLAAWSREQVADYLQAAAVPSHLLPGPKLVPRTKSIAA